MPSPSTVMGRRSRTLCPMSAAEPERPCDLGEDDDGDAPPRQEDDSVHEASDGHREQRLPEPYRRLHIACPDEISRARRSEQAERLADEQHLQAPPIG